MESREQKINRLALSYGRTYEEVKKDLDILHDTGGSLKEAELSMVNLGKEINKINKKRRKPTNYTKPRNRKKKSKY